MFRAALSTVVKTWKQSKCPSTDNWLKKTQYTHTHTHTQWNTTKPQKRMKYSHVQQKQMDLGNIKQSEVRQRQIACNITYMWEAKNNTNDLHIKQKQIHRHRKQTYGYQRI